MTTKHLKRPVLLLALLLSAIVGSAAADKRDERRPAKKKVDESARGVLGSEAQQALAAVPNETTPATTRFYYKSNEWRHDLLRPVLAGKGGALVGIAADQNYTMAALAGSELICVVDFDKRIRMLHLIYGALIPAAETPEALIAFFKDDKSAQAKELIRKAIGDAGDQSFSLQLYDKHRKSWLEYLEQVKGLVREGKPHSWLSDASLYAHVRALHQNKRVWAFTADITGDQTMPALGEALQRAGATVKVLYMSNAEQFIRYSKGFIQNMKNLPTDPQTLVVRTMRHKFLPYAEDDRWAYIVHDFPDFIARLETRAYGRSFAFASDIAAGGSPFLGKDGLNRITAETPRAMAAKKKNAKSVEGGAP